MSSYLSFPEINNSIYNINQKEILNQKIWYKNPFDPQTYNTKVLPDQKIQEIAALLKMDKNLEVVSSSAGLVKGTSQLQVTIKQITDKAAEVLPGTEKKVLAEEQVLKLNPKPVKATTIDKKLNVLPVQDPYASLQAIARDPAQMRSLNLPIKGFIDLVFPGNFKGKEFYLNKIYYVPPTTPTGKGRYYIELAPTFGSGTDGSLKTGDTLHLYVTTKELDYLKGFILEPVKEEFLKKLSPEKLKKLINNLIKNQGQEPYYNGYSLENVYKRKNDYLLVVKQNPGLQRLSDPKPTKQYLLAIPPDLEQL